MTELHFAAYCEDLDAIRACVERGLDVNAKDDAGWTPLVWAVDMAATADHGMAEAIVDYVMAHRASAAFSSDDYEDIVAFAKSLHPTIGAHMERIVEREG